MSADLLQFNNADEDVDVAIEPDDPGIEIEPEPEDPAIEPTAPAPIESLAPLMEVLPADFKLPLLIKFIPNPALRVESDKAATYALGIEIAGRDGVQRADLALASVREAMKAIDEHFDEPTSIANALHKRLTSTRSEWKARAEQAVARVGNAMFNETRRLDRLDAEETRKRQDDADRQARERAREEAERATKAQAPAPVVEELKRQAETATAPPVAATSAPVLRGSTTVSTWKARLIGTPGADEPNPTIEQLSPAQRLKVLELLRAIVEGKAPLAAIELGWSYLNKRAKADKSTLAIAGIESFEEGGVRARASRSK